MTEYRIRGKEGSSEEGVPERGFREGCPSSPILFNVFHQAMMRVAIEEREREAREKGREVGICMKWVPGSAIPGARLWEKPHSEVVEVWVSLSLFADDTTVVGRVRTGVPLRGGRNQLSAGQNAPYRTSYDVWEKTHSQFRCHLIVASPRANSSSSSSLLLPI